MASLPTEASPPGEGGDGTLPMFEIRRTPRRRRLVVVGGLAVVLCCIGLTLLAFIVMTAPSEASLLTLPVVMTTAGAVATFVFVHELLARRAITEMVLELETPVLHLDDGFDFNARIVPRTDLDVNAVFAHFECIERAFFRAGTRSRTFTRVVWAESLQLAERGRCRRDQLVRFGGHFRTPADGMCSFHGANHQVCWRLRIHVDVARWPDVREAFDLEVLPVLGERPPGA